MIASISSPWLSVIIPTFNGATYIRESLESVYGQNDPGIECILIDDGSTDKTLAIARSFTDRLNLRIVEGAARGSWIAGTNDGLRIATAPFACFLHQDDYWLPGRSRHMKALIDAQPNCSLYLHPVEFRDHRGGYLGRWTCPLPSDVSLEDRFVLPRLVVQCFTAINGPIFRTGLAIERGLLDPRLWYTADWDFWIRLVRGQRVAYCPEVLAVFRVHSQSLTVQGSKQSSDFRWQLESVLERSLVENVQTDADVISRARLSVRFNIALAIAHGGNGYGPLCKAVGALLIRGPKYWTRFARDTRIHQRVWARLKAKLLRTF